MNNNFPCKCGHQLDEHEQLTCNFSNPINFVPECNCTIVTTKWFGTFKIAHCLCKEYDSITNLEYLEQQYEQSVSL